MRLLKYILRELYHNRRFCQLFILNLSLGLSGFIALDGFKNSVNKTINARSKNILGADMGLSARRPISDKEKGFIESNSQTNIKTTEMIELFSMVANKNKQSRLIQVKAIQENYPFYGVIKLREGKEVDQKAHAQLKENQEVWVYPEILQQLKVKVGDTLLIGQAEFKISDVIEDDAAAGISTSMAPRIYLSMDQIKATGLISAGSIAWFSTLYQLPGMDSDGLDSLRDRIFKKIDNPDVRIYTHKNASAQMARMLSRLNDFLGLSSLVALFLAGLGTGFLFRAYFKERTKQVAILMSLGLKRRSAFFLYLGQVVTLGFLSSLLAILFSLGLVFGLGALTKGLLPFDIQFSLRLSTILIGIIVGSLGSLCLCLPILVNLQSIKPSKLLMGQEKQEKSPLGPSLLASLPGVLLFWILAVILSKSFLIGSLFTGAFFGSGLILGTIASLIFSGKAIGRFHGSRISLNLALKDLSRNRLTTLSCFISIGLGTLLLSLIPQLQATLDQELQSPEKSKIPSLFLFDIQEEQRDGLEQLVQNNRLSFTQLSPMIRARLIKVNGEEFDKGKGASSDGLSREEEREMRSRNRGFNLSYRAKPIESESIIKGEPFSGNYTGEGLPQISLEKGFAKRLDLEIGDVLTFDIESIEIEGKVVNLRTVRWASFQPNFFIQFQPGVLEPAPKTYIATLPSLSRDKKEKIQDLIVEGFPNVSLINVSRLVARMSKIINQMAWALRFMSLLCLLAGLMVIYSIANYQATNRRFDIGLLKSLGASFGTVRGQFLWQFGMISFFAALLGSMISLGLSYFISSILFESTWAFEIKTPLIGLLATIILTLLVTHFAIGRSLSLKTRELFAN